MQLIISKPFCLYLKNDLQDGLKLLEEACKIVEEKITTAGGSFNFQMKPKVVTSTEEADLQKQLEKLAEENAEVHIIIIASRMHP